MCLFAILEIEVNCLFFVKKPIQLFFIVLLSILIPAWIFFIAPNLLRMPADFSSDVKLVSTDNFYNEKRGAYSGDLYSNSTYTYRTISSTPDTVELLHNFDVKHSDGSPILSISRKYGIDRYTTSHLQNLGDRPRTGHLFAPRNLKPGESFTYWHINYDIPVQLSYVAKEKIQNLTVYRYETTYPDEFIDQTSFLTHLPEVGDTKGVVVQPHLKIWFEPVSGRLIKFQDNAVASYFDLSTKEILYPWNKFSNLVLEESVTENIKNASIDKMQFIAFSMGIPALLIILLLVQFCYYFNLDKYLLKILTLRNIIFFVSGSIFLIAVYPFFIPDSLLDFPQSGLTSSFLFILLATLFIVYELNYPRFGILISLLLTILSVTAIMPYIGLPHLSFESLFHTYTNPVPLNSALLFLLFGIGYISFNIQFLQSLYLPEISMIASFLVSSITLFNGLFLGVLSTHSTIFVSDFILHPVFFLVFSIPALLYIFKQRDPRITTLQWFIFISTVLFSLFITFTASLYLSNSVAHKQYAAFIKQADEHVQAIQGRLNVYVSILESGRGLFVASEQVEDAEWATFLSSFEIQKNYPGIQGIGYAAFITHDNKIAYLLSQQARNPNFSIRPEGDRESYVVVQYIEPKNERNLSAVGFDMYHEDSRRTAMNISIDSSKPQMTENVTLVQEITNNKQPGFIIYLPFHKTGNSTTQVPEGFIYAPFRARDFFDSIFTNRSTVSMKIHNGIESTIGNLLYDNTTHTASLRHSHTITRTINAVGRPWTIHFYFSEQEKDFFDFFLPIFAGFVGTSATILIAITSYVLLNSRQRALDYGEKITKDLKNANEQLASSQQDALNRAQEAERLNKIMIDREMEMIKLKKKFGK